jgi:hypothetical protein
MGFDIFKLLKKDVRKQGAMVFIEFVRNELFINQQLRVNVMTRLRSTL